MSDLTLQPTSASWPFERGVFRKRLDDVRREFDDVVVDGKPLRAWFGADRSDKLIPPLSVEDERDAAFAVVTLDALLGEAAGPYQDGCVPLLICGLDSDAYCGALGVRVAVEAHVVRWRFGWHLLDPVDGSVESHEEPEPTEPGGFVPPTSRR